jgi:hypothetical protein
VEPPASDVDANGTGSPVAPEPSPALVAEEPPAPAEDTKPTERPGSGDPDEPEDLEVPSFIRRRRASGSGSDRR